MAIGLTAFTSLAVDEGEVRFETYCNTHGDPFVVLELGSYETRLHVRNPAHLIALGQVVAEAHDLLTAALAGQDPLPIKPTSVLA